MKKRKTFIHTVLLTTIFLGGGTVNALGYNNRFNITNKTDYNVSINKLEEQYGKEYKNYFENVAKATENGQKIQNILFKSNSETSNYPDYIGGFYIDDDGNYTVQMVKSKLPSKKSLTYSTYDSLTGLESTKIEYVDNSYNDLNEINNRIIAYFSKEKNTIGLLANYVDVNKNAVIVELKDTSYEKISEFKKNVIDSPLIYFVKGEIKLTTANLNPGQLLESTIQCSVGFRAKRNNKPGYVTAGHCLTGHPVDTGINTGTVRVNKVTETLDAAFVETYASYTPTNTLQYTLAGTTTLNVKNINPFYSTGTPVGKSGQKTGAKLGKITNLNWSGTICNDENCTSSIYHSGMIETDIYNARGDSGAPVVLYSYSIKSGDLLGISFAGYDKGNKTYVNKLSTIISGLGVTRY